MRHKTIKHLITSIICLILVAGALFLLTGCDFLSSSREQEQEAAIENTKTSIFVTLNRADNNVPQSITIEKRQDEHGKPYLVGALSDEFDAELEDLVSAYNADPSTTKPITVDEARYSLTIGIVEATTGDTQGSAFRAFLAWTGKAADLVYSWDFTGKDGTKHFEGDPIDAKEITNYMFVVARNSTFENFKFAWE